MDYIASLSFFGAARCLPSLSDTPQALPTLSLLSLRLIALFLGWHQSAVGLSGVQSLSLRDRNFAKKSKNLLRGLLE